jgi:hypothetical protein
MRYLTIIFLFIISNINAQKNYPYLDQDKDGISIIILTEEQARKLDNATEFSPELFKNNAQYFKFVDSLYDKKIKIAIKEVADFKTEEINRIKKDNDKKEMTINGLNNAIDQQKSMISFMENENVNLKQLELLNNQKLKDLQTNLELKELEVKKHKRDTNIAIGFGILSGVVAFLFSL